MICYRRSDALRSRRRWQINHQAQRTQTATRPHETLAPGLGAGRRWWARRRGADDRTDLVMTLRRARASLSAPFRRRPVPNTGTPVCRRSSGRAMLWPTAHRAPPSIGEPSGFLRSSISPRSATHPCRSEKAGASSLTSPDGSMSKHWKPSLPQLNHGDAAAELFPDGIDLASGEHDGHFVVQSGRAVALRDRSQNDRVR